MGLDVGTGSVKCVAASLQGTERWTASASYEYQRPFPGWAEQDPQIWWRSSVLAIRQLLTDHPELRESIKAIGVCGQGAAAVLLDQNYRPCRPAILWLDSRSALEAQSMAEKAGHEIACISGKWPASYNVEPKLSWVKIHEPDVWKNTRHCMTTTAYITYQLCGEPFMNHSDAGILLSYSLQERGWSKRLCELMDLSPEFFCDIAECDQIIGGLTADAAAQTGLPAGIPVVAGGEDTSTAALAAGVVSPELGILSLGTAGTIYTPFQTAVTHPRLLSFPHVLRQQTLVGGSTVCGGSGLEWVARLLSGNSNDVDVEALCQSASENTSRSGKIIFLPYLSGELQPINDGFARGVFFGIDFSTSRLDMVSAVMQGTAFAFAHNLEMTRQLAGGPTALVATGRPARNQAFLQVISDSTGLPIRALASSGGAALGAAILAATGLDPQCNAAAMAQRHSTTACECSPRDEWREELGASFLIYKELYSRVQDLFPRLQASPPHYRCAEAH